MNRMALTAGNVELGSPALTPVVRRAAHSVWLISLAATAGYAFFCIDLKHLPFLDAPNHLARAVVMADALFDGGARFGEVFAVKLSFSGYILGDLLLTELVHLLGPDWAGRLWSTAVFLSVPAALGYLASVLQLHRVAVATAVLVGCYFGTSWFFLSGFNSFQLALSLSLVVAGQLILASERPTAARLVATMALTAVGFFIHPVMVLFACTLCVAIAVSHPAPWRQRLIACGVPFIFAALALLWSVFDPAAAGIKGMSAWAPPMQKILRLIVPAARFGPAYEAPCALLLVLLLGLGLQQWARAARDSRARICAVVAAAFLLLYCVLPVSHGLGHDIDARALAPMYAAILLAVLVGVDLGSQRLQLASWVVGAALAVVNGLTLYHELAPVNQTLAEYRNVIRVVPEGAAVFPVSSVANVGRYQATLQAGSWATIDRGAYIPYLFSGTAADPMSYFLYKRVPTVPPMFWASRPGYQRPDCNEIAQDYGYITIIGATGFVCPGFVTVAISHSPRGNITLLKKAQ
jgi:hypothetical protein